MKIWKFLLPDSGRHCIRVDHIGEAEQQVEIDGQALDAECCRMSVFAGPDGATCELRLQGQDWVLFVNGMMVEDYVASRRRTKDESLRNLKGRPDGSYLIQTEIVADCLDLNIIRKFRFSVQEALHEVQIAHWDWIWQVVLDGAMVERVAHTRTDDSGLANFEVRAPDGTRLPAMVAMQWLPKKNVWNYVLQVAGVEVPVCWTKANGDVQPVVEPMRIGAELPPSSSPSADGGPPRADDAAAIPESPRSPVAAERDLPQGVSYDATSGAFQANIRARTGRFVFLGEFNSADEAHQRYLEAIPLYCPSKGIAPSIAR